MYNIGLTHTDIFTVKVGIIESIGPIAVVDINVCTIHMEAYGDQHIKKAKFMAIANRKSCFCCFNMARRCLNLFVGNVC